MPTSGNEGFSLVKGKKEDAHIHEGILDNPEAEKIIESIRLRKKQEKREMMLRQLREMRGVKLIPVDHNPFEK